MEEEIEMRLGVWEKYGISSKQLFEKMQQVAKEMGNCVDKRGVSAYSLEIILKKKKSLWR